MIMDYNYFKKVRYDSVEKLSEMEEYDCLISSYTEADRVKEISKMIPCKETWWVCTDELNKPEEKEGTRLFQMTDESDGGICAALLSTGYKRLCVDITGFVIPQLLLLLRFFQIRGFTSLDIIYTEPNRYKNNENTLFSDTPLEVRQIMGYAGQHVSDMRNDLLIIAAGYDHSRIIDVASAKKSAKKKVLLFGFPPTSPGMFQENILRAYQAETAVGTDCFKNMDMNIFAPANDPFSTAQALKDYMEHKRLNNFTNVYFSPLASKPQALGMALFYMWEKGWNREWSIIYPFCNIYNDDTATGISRIWKYEVELPK